MSYKKRKSLLGEKVVHLLFLNSGLKMVSKYFIWIYYFIGSLFIRVY